jgi:hypothetical protein
MSANPSHTVAYPEKWTPMEFTCKCGVKYRVDVEFIAGGSASRFYQHCIKDEGQHMPGPIIATWEEQDGAWVVLERYR